MHLVILLVNILFSVLNAYFTDFFILVEYGLVVCKQHSQSRSSNFGSFDVLS